MVLGKLAALVFNDSMIPKLVSAYEQYRQDHSIIETNEQKRLKKQIAELTRSIDNLVSVVLKTASDALVVKINDLEEEKRNLERQIQKLTRKA